MPDTMRAVRIHAYGGPEVLVCEEAPVPPLGTGEVLVRVRAAGVNPVDWKVRSGGSMIARGAPMPLILGWDISGTVEATAPDVTAFKTGDEVYGMVRFPEVGSAYAEFVAAPADHLALKPRTLSHEEAAAVPLAALTAWQGLFDTMSLHPGERLLIHAAAGGVGHFAVQLARWRGAEIVGTASAANADFVRSLGASEVVDYTAVRFEEVIAPVDCVFDCVGAETQTRSLSVLKRGGRMVAITGRADAAAVAAAGVQTQNILVHTSAEQQRQIAELIDAGTLRVDVGAVFPLADAREAHRLSETRRGRGKIVLSV